MKKVFTRRQFMAAAGVAVAAGARTACGGSGKALQVLQPVPLPVLPFPAAPSRWALWAP